MTRFRTGALASALVLVVLFTAWFCFEGACRTGDGRRNAIPTGGEPASNGAAPPFAPEIAAERVEQEPPLRTDTADASAPKEQTALSGRVTDDSPERVPIEDAEVEIAERLLTGWSQTTHTDRDGHYSVVGAPVAAKYAVVVTKRGYFSHRCMSELIVAGDDNAVVDIALARVSIVRGTVTDTQGRELGGAEVTLLETPRGFRSAVTSHGAGDGSRRAVAVTDDLGKYVIEHEFDHYGIDVKLDRFARMSLDREPQQRSTSRRLDLTLQPAGAIAGRVTDVEGRAIGGAELTFRIVAAVAGESLASVRSEDDGTFAVRDLSAGRHRIEVMKSGYARLVTSGESGRIDLHLVLVRNGSLSGSLAPIDAGTVSRLWIVLGRADLANRTAATADAAAEVVVHDGRFQWRGLEPGPYRVAVALTGRAPRQLGVVTISADEDTDVGIVDLPHGVEVVGRVVDERGGVPSASVVAMLEGIDHPFGAPPGIFVREAVTAADGTYRIASVAAGRVILRALVSGRCTREDVALDVRPDGTEIEAPDLQVVPTVMLTGTVVSTEGLPIAGARVELRDRRLNRVEHSDATGAFSFKGIWTGGIVVVASGDGGRRSSPSLELVVDSSSTVEPIRLVIE